MALHDVSGLHFEAAKTFCSQLDEWGVWRRSLAVIPCQDERHPVDRHEPLQQLMREEAARGSEIVLHGWCHRFEGEYERAGDRWRDRLLTGGCAEFSNLDWEEAYARLSRGREMLQAITGRPVVGFTAPGWWQSEGATYSLKHMGFRFSTGTLTLRDLQREQAVRAPVITGLPAERGVMARLVAWYSVRWLPLRLRSSPLVRLALHPYDLASLSFMNGVERLLRRWLQTRQMTVYEELFP